MFWNFSHASSPHIDTVLYKEDLTLQELLEQENVLQELKSQNKKLIEFLTRPDVMEELVGLVTTEPSTELDERERYRAANMACELLTTDLPPLNERLAGSTALLTKLYTFLEGDPPLNSLLASFFTRTMGVLITRKTDQVLDFLKHRQNCIVLLLKHLGISAIMDFTLKLVTQIEGPEMKQNLLNWLDGQGLVDNLIALLNPSVDAERHCNAAQLLCDIINKSRELQREPLNSTEPDPILIVLESPDTVRKLMDTILNGEKSESSIVGGISVLSTLLDHTKPSGPCNDRVMAYGSEDTCSGDVPEPTAFSSVVLTTSQAILPYLPALRDLLLNPPFKPGMQMTFGLVDPPLGNTRLQVAKLFSTLIAVNSPLVNEAIAQLNIVKVLLDLFFTYTWNNFLHTQVEKCLSFALSADLTPQDNAQNNALLTNIFLQCRLLERILEAWDDNDCQQEKPGGCRRGYMGHLIRIANTVCCQSEKGPLGEFISHRLSDETLSSWQAFVANTLANVNKSYETCLGGKHPVHSSSEDEDGEFRDIPFPQNSALQLSYADYQLQEMAPLFIENFGYHEQQFNDGEETNHITEEDEMFRSAELFKQICAQKIQTLEEDDEKEEDEEVWTDHAINPPLRAWNGGEEGANYNSSDDDERAGPEGREEAHMEVDQSDPWLNSDGGGVAALENTSDPWSGGGGPAELDTEASDQNQGWADFDSNFGAATIAQFETVVFVKEAPSSSTTTTSALPNTNSVPIDSAEVSFPPITAVPVETRLEPTGASELSIKADSDNNANINRVAVSTQSSPSQPLIDNYRFLSDRGIIAKREDIAEGVEDKLDPKSISVLETAEESLSVASSEPHTSPALDLAMSPEKMDPV